MLQIGWSVTKYWGYEKFEGLSQFAIKECPTREQYIASRNTLVDDALSNGVKAFGGNKVAFLIEGDGRKMVVAFYDGNIYYIPQ